MKKRWFALVTPVSGPPCITPQNPPSQAFVPPIESCEALLRQLATAVVVAVVTR